MQKKNGETMKGLLRVDLDKCTGCRTCEMACSLEHAKEFNPLKSRIRVVRKKLQGVFVPVHCLQCTSMPCAKVCPVEAIYRDENTWAVLIDYDKCIGCGECARACPFGAITYDPDTKQVIKCDLCGGNPKCVEYCIDKAIQFLPFEDVERNKRFVHVDKVARAYLTDKEWAEGMI